MGLPSPNTQSPQSIRNRLGVEAKTLAHFNQRVASLIEGSCLLYLILRHVPRALGNAVAIKDRYDRGSVEAKGARNVVHRASCLVRPHDL
ncbi:hypothetical protein [Demequina sp.]|uniref:hypothetical protein n=1 Tax=Demequina sp. TaxID=2050685 RepID=UPI003D148E3B